MDLRTKYLVIVAGFFFFLCFIPTVVMVCIKLSGNKGEDDSNDEKIISGGMSDKEKKNVSEQKSKQEDLVKEKASYKKLSKKLVSKEILPQNNVTQEHATQVKLQENATQVNVSHNIAVQENAAQIKLPENIAVQENAAQIKFPENILAQDMISNDNSEQVNPSQENLIQEITPLEPLSQETPEQKKLSRVNSNLDLNLNELDNLDKLNLQQGLLNSLSDPQDFSKEGVELLNELTENVYGEQSQDDEEEEESFETALEDNNVSSFENSETSAINNQ